MASAKNGVSDAHSVLELTANWHGHFASISENGMIASKNTSTIQKNGLKSAKFLYVQICQTLFETNSTENAATMNSLDVVS